jgi:L-threonylcarbamoyladenylate synthase
MERVNIEHASEQELEQVIKKAATILLEGGVIVYPTDTVYGLGADATNRDAVRRVVQAKQRDPEKPMLVMVRDLTMVESMAELTSLARALAEAFLPGPLSLQLEKTQHAPEAPIGDGFSIGIRMPKNRFCRSLAEQFDMPITSTSVNRAGEAQPRTLDAMLAALGDQAKNIDLVIDAGTLPESLPSTLVDARGEKAIILREGALSSETLSSFL